MKVRYCVEHPENETIVNCMNQFCKLNRIICFECIKNHTAHSDNLIDKLQFSQFIAKTKENCNKVVQQINQIFSEMSATFKFLMEQLQHKFNISIDTINEMEILDLNQFIQDMVLFDSDKNTLIQTLQNQSITFSKLIDEFPSRLKLKSLMNESINQPQSNIILYNSGYWYCNLSQYTNPYTILNSEYTKCYDDSLTNFNNIHPFSGITGISLSSLKTFKESLLDKAFQNNPGYEILLCEQTKKLF